MQKEIWLPLDKCRPWNKCHVWQIAAWMQNAFNPFQTPPKAITRSITFPRLLHWHISACDVWPCINVVGCQRGVAPDQGAYTATAHPAAEFLGPSSLTCPSGRHFLPTAASMKCRWCVWITAMKVWSLTVPVTGELFVASHNYPFC